VGCLKSSLIISSNGICTLPLKRNGKKGNVNLQLRNAVVTNCICHYHQLFVSIIPYPSPPAAELANKTKKNSHLSKLKAVFFIGGEGGISLASRASSLVLPEASLQAVKKLVSFADYGFFVSWRLQASLRARYEKSLSSRAQAFCCLRRGRVRHLPLQSFIYQIVTN
jgi:hypothetical protein